MKSVDINIVVTWEHGFGEILLLESESGLRLPASELLPGENSFCAARRIARDQLGVIAEPLRLLYLMEREPESMVLIILCELVGDDGEPNERAVSADISRVERDFDPACLREVLTEDSASGFYRPTAHVVVKTDLSGAVEIDISW